MKRSIKLLGLFLILTILIGCNSNEKVEEISKENGILYSNISDEKSIDEIRMVLEKVELPKENIERFLREVEDYNSTIEYIDLTKKGFEKNNSIDPDYDTIKMMELWEEEKGMFIGNNCRMTSFDLMDSLIKIDTDINIEGSNLFMDLDAIQYSSNKYWDENNIKKFKSLYGNMKTEDTKDVGIHIKQFQDELEKRNIEFPKNSKVSHISVVFHDTLDSVLFIGHAGVLVDFDDELLFIEKLNFSEPYQAIKFSSRQALNDYLMQKYDISYNQPEAKPFIMENNSLIEGYRPNKNNLEG